MSNVTLNAFLDHLKDASPEAGVSFATEKGPVGAGYHITELKHATVASIDCGGRRSSWDEAALQVLDVYGEMPMPVSKLSEILARSIDAIPGLGTAPVHVEFGHGNRMLSRYDVAGIDIGRAHVRISLAGAHASCKPAREKAVTGTSCCA